MPVLPRPLHRLCLIAARAVCPRSYYGVFSNLTLLGRSPRWAWLVLPGLAFWTGRRRFADAELNAFLRYCAARYPESSSQLYQDLLVVWLLGAKREGYFVDIGACDGRYLSNSYVLETRYGWKGIAAEPARCWQEALARNRRCHISGACLWHRSGEVLTFKEVSEQGFSTLCGFESLDMHGTRRASGITYAVATMTLTDLLRRFDAPEVIDYLSLDTEGSELEVLSGCDFGAYRFRLITVEHNYVAPKREAIRLLLEAQGYQRFFAEISGCDDWYRLLSMDV